MTNFLNTLSRNQKCPQVCPCIECGAFITAERSPEKVLEEFKGKEGIAAAELSKISPPMIDPTFCIDSIKFNCPQDYEYMPGLEPVPDGKIDWTPLAAMTGTRPAVHKYSLSRYSVGEWRAHNASVLK